MEPRWTTRQPKELIVHDAPYPCPYLPGRDARLPMRLPSRALSASELDQRLAEGDRRHGPFLYRPSCGECQECQAIRLPVAELRSRRSHRRILTKGDRVFRVELGPPTVDDARLELYAKHKRERDLVTGTVGSLDRRGYESFLVDRCAPAFEMRFWDGDVLAAVAVVDRGETALSAVYCLWDPSYTNVSLGNYSILKQVELCRRLALQHLYLGLYIAENRHMNYKARFKPNERLIDGRWQRFE